MLSRVGEVRSLVPPSVRVMALTATATKTDRLAVSRALGLNHPFVMARCQNKSNIIYRVSKFNTISDTFRAFANMLKQERNLFPKTIIYGQSFGVCGDIYSFFKNHLREMFTVIPTAAPDLPEFRLVEMFTSVTDSDHKEKSYSYSR